MKLIKRMDVAWLTPPSYLELYETSIIPEQNVTSVFGFILDSENKILVIHNKKTNRSYEIPGGHIESSDLDETRSDLSASLKAQPGRLPEEVKTEDVDKILEIFTAAWFQNFLQYDPSVALEQVDCPVLAINGAKDLQIPAEENLGAIKLALDKAGNEMVTIKKIPKLNHLFQEADTGLPDEYSTIEQTFSPLALEEIGAWIKLRTKE